MLLFCYVSVVVFTWICQSSFRRAAILCQGILRHDTLQCILNILKRPQAPAQTFSLSHYNPNRKTLMSVLLPKDSLGAC